MLTSRKLFYTNPRYPNQELSPYQYDMQATQDALFKVTPGTGVNPPTLSNQRKTQPETYDSNSKYS